MYRQPLTRSSRLARPPRPTSFSGIRSNSCGAAGVPDSQTPSRPGSTSGGPVSASNSSLRSLTLPANLSRQSSIRAYLVVPGGSKDAVTGWYDRTLATNGWSKVASMPDSFGYRLEPGESLLVTFTPRPSQLGYAVSGLG